MKEEIKIVYQHYVPDELITGFEKLQLSSQLQVDIKNEKEEQKYYNFAGPEIADIVIYIQQNTTELIVNGLLAKLAYDALKGGLKFLWTEISKLAIKKLQANGKETDTSKSIYLRLSNKERAVEVLLEGNIDNDKADKVIDDALKFVSSENLNKIFENPDFIEGKIEKPRIRIKFNREKQIWEPENFGEYRRKIEEYQKWAGENFNN